MMTSRRRTWFLIRLVVYVAIVAALFAVRGAPDWRAMGRLITGKAAADSVLTIAGCDLAPDLTDKLLESYRRDYPALSVRTTPGGTNHPHHHPTEEEVYLLLEGSGEMVAGGGVDGVEGRRPATPGDAFFYRLNATVGFYADPSPNAGKARILAVRSRYPFPK